LTIEVDKGVERRKEKRQKEGKRRERKEVRSSYMIIKTK
jgi:hypothetical protein